MNVRIFWVRAMKCMCAQTRPRFILSSERILGGSGVWTHVNSKGKKSPLPESFPRGGSNLRRCRQRAQTLPTSYSGPPNFSTKFFHTCHVNGHHWLLLFYTTSSVLDFGWGSQSRYQAKHVGFIFLHTFQLKVMKRGMVMKQCMLKMLKLFLSEIYEYGKSCWYVCIFIFVHVSVYVFMHRHVYVYECDCFRYVHMCTYCICIQVMTMYSAVKILLVSNCAI